MIEATKAYKTGDGQTFSELRDAQAHELKALNIDNGEAILEQAEAVIGILKLKPRKARAKAKKAKAPKVVAAA